MSTPHILEKQILATVVYYDILDYPLTSFEIFLYLIKENQESRIKNQELDGNFDRNQDNNIQYFLSSSEYLKKYLGQKSGFYFLRNREGIIRQRLSRKKLADQKWKKIKKIFWIMQIVPFIKMVLVSGSLALGNSRKNSDVDIMIIAKNGRIWTTRIFLTALIFLLGVRRNERSTRDKICLNHYITDRSLQIPFRSLYDAHTYAHLINVYDDENSMKMFRDFQKSNIWIKNYIQNYSLSELKFLTSVKKNKMLVFMATVFEFVLSGKSGDYFEKILSIIQIAKIKKNPSFKNKGGRIIMGDDQLEFHPKLHEKIIIPEFNERMKELELFEFGKQKGSGLT